MTRNFSKTQIQKNAIKLLASSAKNIMLFGGSRSGKSFIIIYALFVRACKTKSRHVCLRFKFNHIKTSLWMDTVRKVHSICFPNCGAKYNNTDFYITFPNGSEIWFSGLDNADRTEKILGKEYSTLFFNECSQLDLSSINIAKTRLAEKNNLKKMCIYDQNPPSKRHWSYWIFEKHWDPLAEEELDKLDYVSIKMNPKDNITNIDEDYIKLLEKMPEKDRNRFLYGQYVDADDGQVYYSFNREDHVKEFESLHGATWVGMDFNVDPMTAVLCKIGDDELYVYDEIFQRNSDTPKLGKELKTRATGKQIYIAPDSTAKNRKTSGKSDLLILRELFGSNAVLPTRNPFVTDRVNNLNRLFQEKRIYIHPRCKKLINDLEKVFWSGNQLDQKTDPLLTHISDALGYIAWKQFPYTGTGQGTIKIS